VKIQFYIFKKKKESDVYHYWIRAFTLKETAAYKYLLRLSM